MFYQHILNKTTYYITTLVLIWSWKVHYTSSLREIRCNDDSILTQLLFLQLLMKTSACQIAKGASPVEQVRLAFQQVSVSYRIEQLCPL